MAVTLYSLSVYAINLPNIAKAGIFNREVIDPYAVVKLNSTDDDGNTEVSVLGRTETIFNTMRPVWVESFDIHYDPVTSAGEIITVDVFHDTEGENDIKILEGIKFELDDILQKDHKTKIHRLHEGGT